MSNRYKYSSAQDARTGRQEEGAVEAAQSKVPCGGNEDKSQS